jgi:hypothetical protein
MTRGNSGRKDVSAPEFKPLTLVSVAVAILVLISLLPVDAKAASDQAPLDEASSDTSRVLAFAREKYVHLVTRSDYGDPMRDIVNERFCQSAMRLQIGDVCSARFSRSKVYLINVLEMQNYRIKDVVVISSSNAKIYSLYEQGGVQRWLREEEARCATSAEFFRFVLLHVRLLRTPEETQLPEGKMCAAVEVEKETKTEQDEIDESECEEPKVRKVDGGYSILAKVKSEPGTGKSGDGWDLWSFSFLNGSYEARIVRTEDGSIR